MRLPEFTFVSLASVVLGFGASRAAEPASSTANEIRMLIEGNTSFAVDFYRQLRSSEGNLFFSPYSISSALALAYGGARGETEKQMAKVLHFSLDQSDLHAGFRALQNHLDVVQKYAGKLSVANSLWPQQHYEFRQAYLSLAREYYGVSITPVDYKLATEAARRQINLWVEEKTTGKIKDVIPPGTLDPLTRLVLVNAIYFNATWMNRFSPRVTTDAPFHVLGEKTVPAPMMTQTNAMAYAEAETLQILSLPYQGGVSMLVLLPKKADGLKQLEDDLSIENLKSWKEQLRSRQVEVFLPKFKITRHFLLNAVLQAMGMTDAFSLPSADFSGMTGAQQLCISAVVHKAFVDVDEKGTEAAAATALAKKAARKAGEPPKPPAVFRADHPFLFLIQDNETGTILFLGRLTDPIQGG